MKKTSCTPYATGNARRRSASFLLIIFRIGEAEFIKVIQAWRKSKGEQLIEAGKSESYCLRHGWVYGAEKCEKCTTLPASHES